MMINRLNPTLLVAIPWIICQHVGVVSSFTLQILRGQNHGLQSTRKLQRMRNTNLYMNMETKPSDSQVSGIGIALTREDGKNAKILKAIQSHSRIIGSSCSLIEIPCIEHAHGPDSGETFISTLSSSPSTFDYIAVTSPEAAQVFASTLQLTNISIENLPQVCAVGKATEESLRAKGIPVSFTPSKATAATLVNELPAISKDRATINVLYPASAKAKKTLQKGLEARTDTSFKVTRLDTYDTVPAKWTEEQLKIAQEDIKIVCFGSPSAVQSWVEKVNEMGSKNIATKSLAACIGETSAQACREMGWKEEDIYYPDKPGIPGWTESVADAMDRIQKDQN